MHWGLNMARKWLPEAECISEIYGMKMDVMESVRSEQNGWLISMTIPEGPRSGNGMALNRWPTITLTNDDLYDYGT